MTDGSIRPMIEEDIPLITEWMLAIALWQRYGMTEEQIDCEFRDAMHRVDLLLVADAEEPAVGMAWCMMTGMFGAQPYLKRLGVSPAFSGRKLGHLLLQRVEREACMLGKRTMFLLVSDFNQDAQRFYGHHGYQHVGVLPDLVLDNVGELIFSKELASLAY